jgi:hypothetical protein
MSLTATAICPLSERQDDEVEERQEDHSSSSSSDGRGRDVASTDRMLHSRRWHGLLPRLPLAKRDERGHPRHSCLRITHSHVRSPVAPVRMSVGDTSLLICCSTYV